MNEIKIGTVIKLIDELTMCREFYTIVYIDQDFELGNVFLYLQSEYSDLNTEIEPNIPPYCKIISINDSYEIVQ